MFPQFPSFGQNTSVLNSKSKPSLKFKGKQEDIALNTAVYQGDIGAAKLALSQGADVNHISGGFSPVEKAASRRNIEMVNLLLNHDADIQKFVNRINPQFNQIQLPRRIEYVRGVLDSDNWNWSKSDSKENMTHFFTKLLIERQKNHQQLNQQLDGLNTESAALNEKNTALSGLTTELKSTLAEKEQHVDTAHKLLGVLDQGNQNQTQALREKNAMQMLRTVMNRWHARKHGEKLASTEERVQNLEAENSDLTAHTHLLGGSLTQVRADLIAQEEKLQEAREQRAQLEGTLKAAEEKIHEQSILRHKRSQELETTKQDFEDQKADFIKRARGRLSTKDQEIEKLKQDENALRQDLQGKLDELKSARARSTDRKVELAKANAEKDGANAKFELVNQWLTQTRDDLEKSFAQSQNERKARETTEQKLVANEQKLAAKLTQTVQLSERLKLLGANRQQVITFAEEESEAQQSRSRRRFSISQNPDQSTLLDQSDNRSERSSQDNETWASRSELSDTSRNSVELDSQSRSSSPVYELSAEPLSLDRLPRPLQERFELGLQERERDYQDSLSSQASSASRSQSSQAKSTHSQSSTKSGTSVTSWFSDGVKSVNSVFSQRDDKSSSDEGSILDAPLKGRKGLVFKRTATRRIVEDPHPSRKLRSNASTTSLRSKKSDVSDQEYFAFRKPDELEKMYQEGKPDENTELFDAIYHNKKQDMEQILRDNPRAWKLKDKEGRSPIHWAAILGQAHTIDSILKPLSIQKRQDLLNDADAKGLAPIHYAAEQNQVKAADILANKYQADLSLKSNGTMSYKQNVFHIATDKGRSKLLQKLLPNAPITALNEPDVHERTPLMYAAMRGQPKLIRSLLRKKGIETLKQDASHKDAFYHAVQHGVDNKNWKPVRKFLQAKHLGRVKIALDAHNPQLEYSSFGLLAAHAPKRVVKTALKFKHFNPNQSIFKKNWSHGYKYFTPFSLAASKEHVEGMEALAEDDRVKPRALSEMQGRSAYHIALDHNQPEAEKFLRTSPLIKKPMKLNKRDAKGRSPKRVGTRAGAAEAVESHLENSPGERKPFRFRKRDIEVGKMKRSDKAAALDKLAEAGKRLRLR
jgi:ankyrin repeat protein